MDITPEYVNSVVVGDIGKEAMMLAGRVACDVYSGINIDYLNSSDIIEKTNVCFCSGQTLCSELKNFVKFKESLLSKTEEDPMEKNTGSTAFTIFDAKAACESYIQDLWKAVATRTELTLECM